MEWIKEILTKMNVIDDFDEDTEMILLGFDSLKLLELIVEIEEHFGITLEEQDLDMTNFGTIASVIKLIEKYIGK